MTGPVGTGSSYRLAVSAEMVFVDLPFEDRVRRITDRGFEVVLGVIATPAAPLLLQHSRLPMT